LNSNRPNTLIQLLHIYRSIALKHWSSRMRHSLCAIQCHLDQANSVRNKCQKWDLKWGFQPDLRIQDRTHIQVSEIQLGYVKGLLSSTCQMQGFYSICCCECATINDYSQLYSYFLPSFFWEGALRRRKSRKQQDRLQQGRSSSPEWSANRMA